MSDTDDAAEIINRTKTHTALLQPVPVSTPQRLGPDPFDAIDSTEREQERRHGRLFEACSCSRS